MLSTASIVLSNIPMSGNLCTANGFIGQWTVQAADFSTLAIALVTFYILLNSSNAVNAMNSVNRYIYLIIALIWGVSFSTALVGYFIAGYAWTGTWCWFPEQALYPRYFLTHGPRIKDINQNKRLKKDIQINDKNQKLNQSDTSANQKNNQVNKTVNKMLLFPILYVLLWSGGMANRILDATTGATDLSRFLQGFTQFIPFADSILYASVIGIRKIRSDSSQSSYSKSMIKSISA
ncbi:hypothetical protein HK099_001120 [Clydaea vesicula]|uniref:Glucose receptor Git3-like N-terminal domain-containing protein n=1 Tax=Clydaea vesicula TaxID=447962 RepID=A0AAD5Y1Q0_9FUNG|nr:hypothetical protein HK099_001120 [Clydaea vesicula]